MIGQVGKILGIVIIGLGGWVGAKTRPVGFGQFRRDKGRAQAGRPAVVAGDERGRLLPRRLVRARGERVDILGQAVTVMRGEMLGALR